MSVETQKAHAHAAIIDAFDGSAELARLISEELQEDVSMERVSMWRTRGIPHAFRPTVSLLALRRSIAIPSDFMRPRARRSAISAEQVAG